VAPSAPTAASHPSAYAEGTGVRLRGHWSREADHSAPSPSHGFARSAGAAFGEAVTVGGREASEGMWRVRVTFDMRVLCAERRRGARWHHAERARRMLRVVVACCMLHGTVAVTPPVPPHEQRSLRLTIIVSTLCLSLSLARTHSHMHAHTDTHTPVHAHAHAHPRAYAPTRTCTQTRPYAHTRVYRHA
jgi:hypothetical protein